MATLSLLAVLAQSSALATVTLKVKSSMAVCKNKEQTMHKSLLALNHSLSKMCKDSSKDGKDGKDGKEICSRQLI